MFLFVFSAVAAQQAQSDDLVKMIQQELKLLKEDIRQLQKTIYSQTHKEEEAEPTSNNLQFYDTGITLRSPVREFPTKRPKILPYPYPSPELQFSSNSESSNAIRDEVFENAQNDKSQILLNRNSLSGSRHSDSWRFGQPSPKNSYAVTTVATFPGEKPTKGGTTYSPLTPKYMGFSNSINAKPEIPILRRPYRPYGTKRTSPLIGERNAPRPADPIIKAPVVVPPPEQPGPVNPIILETKPAANIHYEPRIKEIYPPRKTPKPEPADVELNDANSINELNAQAQFRNY